VSFDRQIIQIRPWTDENFANSNTQWRELLECCDVDPLFMSWDWQWLWWRHYGPELKAKLFILAGYSTDGTLVGLAPFYTRRATHRGGVNANRIESLGSNWRCRNGVFSEYLDVLAARGHEREFIAAVADTILADSNWSDLVISNSRPDGAAARLIGALQNERCYVREMDPLAAHVASLPSRFGDYVVALKSSMRRKLWNHRARLIKPQMVLGEAKDVVNLFHLMNSLHMNRWGRHTFEGLRGRFHQALALTFAKRNELRFSTLVVNGDPISIAYNARIGETEYSIQSAFKPHAIRGVSPGYLHFGYCIEQACADGVKKFDFLAGTGRNRDYKREFLTSSTSLVTLQAIRSRPLSWLYRAYDRRLSKRPRVLLPRPQ
jgi:CelD/BcsL family acetyltransferase involved in cellulose biosynthesis